MEKKQYIYVASSWRNEIQQSVVLKLRKEKFAVYDFKNPKIENKGFHWSDIDSEWQKWTPKQFIEGLKHPIAQNGFNFDMQALIQCDACILVMPCGRSAHLELGYCIGQNKKTYILLSNGEPELMYKMANMVTDNLEDIINDLK